MRQKNFRIMIKLLKPLFIGIAIFGLALCSMATPVDQTTAKTIVSKFIGTNNVQLSITYTTESNAAALYVFNTADGFVIVAADDCETPIIAYSHEGHFDPNNIPMQMEEYLQDFVAKIQYGIENHIEADETTARQWELVKTEGRLNESKSAKAVPALLTSKWHQGCLYNSLCPTGQGPCDHFEAGCVAVAMGQIMHYWNYPSKGWGSNTYNNQGITLSADFGNTTYDWSHMPDSLNEDSSIAEIEAVATLLYHCGVSVYMKYNSSSSTTDPGNIPNALIRYFNYSRRLHNEKRSNYSDEEWLHMLKRCLDLQQPVCYAGYGNQGGHAFVCDGYDDNDLLHFNWGWGTANGYFALGNLNPLGYHFNESQSAIFDIYPHYEPCLVFASANPPTAGTIEGCGEYHLGETCTLIPIPSDGYVFYCWKKEGLVISKALSYTFNVEDDTINLEAVFSHYLVDQITASYHPEPNNPNSPNVSLTWPYEDPQWNLLKQFEIHGETGGLATDGENIYLTYTPWDNPPFNFEKHSMDGELEESFNMNDVTNVFSLFYDGTDYYCNTITNPNTVGFLFRVDLEEKTILDSIDLGILGVIMSYAPESDGFWAADDHHVLLYDRLGHRIKTGPYHPDYIYGGGYYTAIDSTTHLLVVRDSGIYDYDIANNFFDRCLIPFEGGAIVQYGACTGKYDSKDAVFFGVGDAVYIYEVKNTFVQIMNYRIYRADMEGNIVLLSDDVQGASYTDDTWGNAFAGMYRFGISMVFDNGNESEIIWSDYIEKTDYGIDEGNHEPTNPSVQKAFEDGHIIIIKNGKRYTVTGQQLN